MTECSCCGGAADAHKLITCAVCRKVYLHTCIGLSASEARTIKSNKNLSWTCKTCLQVGSDINELKAAVLALKAELADLKNQKSTGGLSDCTFEDVVAEVQERERRKCNIIAYGFAEHAEPSRVTRAEQDKRLASQLFQFLNVNCSIRTVSRLGKFDSTKPTKRPLKVVLDDVNSVHKLIRNASKLKSDDNFKHVNLSFDRTPRQASHYQNLRKELLERQARGEVNLKIKYVQGVQRIVQEN